MTAAYPGLPIGEVVLFVVLPLLLAIGLGLSAFRLIRGPGTPTSGGGPR